MLPRLWLAAVAAAAASPVLHAPNSGPAPAGCSALVAINGCDFDLSRLDFANGTRVRDICAPQCLQDSLLPSAASRMLQEEEAGHGGDAGHRKEPGGREEARGSGGEGREGAEGGAENEEAGEGEDDDDEAEEGEGGVGERMDSRTANVTAMTLVGLIVATIGFEVLHSWLEAAAGEQLEEIVDAMFGELTVLGFIGLLAFISIRTGAATALGKRLFPADEEGEEFVEVLEELHMLLFFVMVGGCPSERGLPSLGPALAPRFTCLYLRQPDACCDRHL
eukprot:SAG22_NODE_1432_length_4436_cov_4.264007_2_plen_278_part_00